MEFKALMQQFGMNKGDGKLITPLKIPGPELSARVDLQEEVEDHHPGLHSLTTRREHEEEEPGCVQYVGLRS